MDTTSILALVGTSITVLGGAITALWKWVISKLAACEEKHAHCEAVATKLNTDLGDLKYRLGRLEGCLRLSDTDTTMLDTPAADG